MKGFGGRAFGGNLFGGRACGVRLVGGGLGGGLIGGRVVDRGLRGSRYRACGMDELIDARTERVDLIVQVHACFLYVRPAILPVAPCVVRARRVTKCWPGVGIGAHVLPGRAKRSASVRQPVDARMRRRRNSRSWRGVVARKPEHPKRALTSVPRVPARA
ncbi:hypothetical protein [Burkholderia plantarii]|uniref:hypothetical protein n=1 Tax=Burkholderia plantarii TaxID=41899 RepID=UPI001F5B7E81|nr:hypothetical protein [Burkholderia plantarii]